MRVHRRWRWGILGSLMLASLGCKSIPKTDQQMAARPVVSSVSKVVVLWTEAVLRQNDVPMAQGFAGKVYLFGPDSTGPVTAPGKFKVFAYDETKAQNQGADGKSPAPDGTWEFQESDLRSLLKKDAIGWSYSLWVPYGPPVGAERRVNLRLSFTPEGGPQLLSESALIMLPAVDPVGSGRPRTAGAEQKKAAANAASVRLSFQPPDELL